MVMMLHRPARSGLKFGLLRPELQVCAVSLQALRAALLSVRVLHAHAKLTQGQVAALKLCFKMP